MGIGMGTPFAAVASELLASATKFLHVASEFCVTTLQFSSNEINRNITIDSRKTGTFIPPQDLEFASSRH